MSMKPVKNWPSLGCVSPAARFMKPCCCDCCCDSDMERLVMGPRTSAVLLLMLPLRADPGPPIGDEKASTAAPVVIEISPADCCFGCRRAAEDPRETGSMCGGSVGVFARTEAATSAITLMTRLVVWIILLKEGDHSADEVEVATCAGRVNILGADHRWDTLAPLLQLGVETADFSLELGGRDSGAMVQRRGNTALNLGEAYLLEEEVERHIIGVVVHAVAVGWVLLG
ncbi:hypothetical protein ColTof3_12006 [Colletotrichum tofieldiae]|nr:hypothetical protein ColTof3_12006 [Colletotrichum tofieldiae]